MTTTTDRLQRTIERFPGSTVLIVGDVMLDQFVVGRVNRISPEAPVPVVCYDRDEYRVGGAANVANNVRALGGRVELVGLVGADAAGQRLRQLLHSLGMGTTGLISDAGRRTTTKLRVVTDRNQQVARIDYETDDEANGAIEQGLAMQAEALALRASVIVVSDYLKGSITRTVMSRLVAAGRARSIPVLVDPKIPHLDYYAGASLVTPNHHESEIAAHMRVRTLDEAVQAARIFRERARCERVLITRGEHGMCLVDGEQSRCFPAVAREVADVTGAGDTVIATIAMALAASAGLEEACILANHAAGIVVGRFGPAAVNASELAAAISSTRPSA